MVDSNKAVFDVANMVANEAIVTAAGRSAENFRTEVQKWLKDYSRSFYIDMLAMLQEQYSGVYARMAPLSPEYAARKLARGLGEKDSFMFFSGALEDYLLGRNPERDFGKSIARFTDLSSGLSSMVRIDRAGRPQFRAGSGRRGFAPRNMAYQDIRFSLEVIMFPEVRGTNFGQSGNHRLFNVYPNRTLRTRFAVFEFGRTKNGRQPARPLLIPHMKFYAGTNLRNKFARQFGVTPR